MSFDPSSIESDLRRLRASSLDDSLLARLESCADDSWTRISPVEAALEQQLKSHAPAPLPPALMACLLDKVSIVPFPDGNIVRFPATRPATPHVHRQPRWWSAAAAVALAGALTALVVPTHSPNQTPLSTAPSKSSGQVAPNTPNTTSELVPAGFNRGLADASDEGIIWQKDNRPHRVLRVVYQDRVTLKDANGKTYQVEQPRVEYILVPEQTN